MKQMCVRSVIVGYPVTFDAHAIVCFTCDSCCNFGKLDAVDHRIYPQDNMISEVNEIIVKL